MMGWRARSTGSVAAAVANDRHLVGNVSSTGAENALRKNRSTVAASNNTPCLSIFAASGQPITPDYVTTNAAYCLCRCAAEHFVALSGRQLDRAAVSRTW